MSVLFWNVFELMAIAEAVYTFLTSEMDSIVMQSESEEVRRKMLMDDEIEVDLRHMMKLPYHRVLDGLQLFFSEVVPNSFYDCDKDVLYDWKKKIECRMRELSEAVHNHPFVKEKAMEMALAETEGLNERVIKTLSSKN